MSTGASVSSSGGRYARDLALAALIQRCSARDESALAQIYDETSQYVYGIALHLLRNAADAEEVTLDVYNQVWRSASTYSKDRGSVTSWLVMLARSRSLDRLRSRANRSKREDPLGDGQTMVVWAGDTPEQSAAQRQQRERIERALGVLSREHRQVLELAFFGGYTHTELAEHLGEPLGTVKTRIRAGMMKLREALDGI